MQSSGKRESRYTIRIWRYGKQLKKYSGLTRQEAAGLWKENFDLEDRGVELLKDGEHVKMSRVSRTLGLKQSPLRIKQ